MGEPLDEARKVAYDGLLDYLNEHIEFFLPDIDPEDEPIDPSHYRITGFLLHHEATDLVDESKYGGADVRIFAARHRVTVWSAIGMCKIYSDEGDNE